MTKKFRFPTEKDAKKILASLTRREMKNRETGFDELDLEETHDGIFPTSSICPVCGGRVVRHTTSQYFGDPLNQIMGPGSRNQMTTVTQYYCETCKVIFVSPPLVIKKKK